MTADEIIEILGWPRNTGLHNSDLLRRIMDVVAAERDACARECWEFYSVDGIAQKCNAAIRARGEAPEDKP